MSGLSGLLDIHAPVKTKQLIKPAPSWITDEYRTAKCMRRQFERAWRRDKSPENRSRLRRQINRCNHIKESPSKTCSLDPCPTHIVKQCIDILLPSLTKLVNFSLKNGIFPNPFKQAIVTPLLKKSTLSKEDLKSYRPVSGLSFLSKLVERIVAAQIRSHMDSHDLGNTFQSAYKVGHSAETALLCIKNEIHLSLSKGMPTALVLLDLSAAFDTIDHDTLLSCLSSRFGFVGSALKWFRSYLQDRFQSVKIGSSLSNLFKLKFGVPQGSVLGPLLFSLYTTPLGHQKIYRSPLPLLCGRHSVVHSLIP